VGCRSLATGCCSLIEVWLRLDADGRPETSAIGSPASLNPGLEVVRGGNPCAAPFDIIRAKELTAGLMSLVKDICFFAGAGGGEGGGEVADSIDGRSG